MDEHRIGSRQAWIVVVAAIGGVVATYWDDAWHTVIGRDSALIPPHLLLYGAIAVVGAALGWWVLSVLWRTRSVRTLLRVPGMLLAVVAGLATVLAAAADVGWHAAFGRDAVLWSPPHLLSVVATAVLVVAVFVGVGRSASVFLQTALSAVLLGAAQIVVLEYDTDVPQFGEWLYLPVLVVVGLGWAFVVRTLAPRPGVLMWSVVVYFGLRLVVFAVLSLAGWIGPDAPLALAGLLLLETSVIGGVVRWPLAGIAMAALQLVASATGISSVSLAPAAAGAAVVVPVLALLALRGRRVWQAGAFVAVLAVLPVLSPLPARAHDPGQGEEVGTVQLTAQRRDDTRWVVRASAVDGVEPIRLAARRAGKTVTAPLDADGTDRFRGELVLPSVGLWFVYVELRSGGRTVESWLPIDTERAVAASDRRSLYVPAGSGSAPVGEYLAGAALFAVSAFLIGMAVIEVRRRGRYYAS